MEKNVGGLERGLRMVLGPLVLLASIASLRKSGNRVPALGLIGLVVGGTLTATGLTRTCPANAAMGRDTYRPSEDLDEETREVRENALQ